MQDLAENQTQDYTTTQWSGQGCEMQDLAENKTQDNNTTQLCGQCCETQEARRNGTVGETLGSRQDRGMTASLQA